jgi:hypothetical protein
VEELIDRNVVTDPVVVAAVVQALATITLVGVTAWYGRRTSALAKQAKAQSELARQGVEAASMPVVRIVRCHPTDDLTSVELIIDNVGNGPAIDVEIRLFTIGESSHKLYRHEPNLAIDIVGAGERSPNADTTSPQEPPYLDLQLDVSDEGAAAIWHRALSNHTPRWGIHVDYVDLFGTPFRVEYDALQEARTVKREPPRRKSRPITIHSDKAPQNSG